MTQEVTNSVENYAKLKSIQFYKWTLERVATTKVGHIVDGLLYRESELFDLFEAEISGEMFDKITLSITKLCKVDLSETNRERENLVPRQVAMSLLLVFSTLTLKQIGSIFHKDHATVLHAVKCIESGYSCNDALIEPILIPAFMSLYGRFKETVDISVSGNPNTESKITAITRRLNKYEFSKSLIREYNRLKLVEFVPELAAC